VRGAWQALADGWQGGKLNSRSMPMVEHRDLASPPGYCL